MTEESREEYTITPVPLGANLTDKAFYFDANVLVVAQIPITVMARINDLANPQVDLAIFRRLDMKVKVLYLTTTTTSTTDLLLFASKAVSVDTAGFGARVLLVDSAELTYDARMVKAVEQLTNKDNIDDGAEEASGEIVTAGYNKITGWVIADQVLTIDVYVYQATGETARQIDTITTVANTPYGFEIPVVAPIMEIRFDNDSGTNTTTCEKSVSLSTGV